MHFFCAQILQKYLEIRNKYITGLNQLEAKAAFLARLGGEKGTLTDKDIIRSLKNFISLSGDIDEYINNMETGLASLDSIMARQAYLHEDMGDFRKWRSSLHKLGYELNESGNFTPRRDLP